MDDGLLQVEAAFKEAEAAWLAVNVAWTTYIKAAAVQDYALAATETGRARLEAMGVVLQDTLGVENNAWAGLDQALDAFKEVWLTATQEALISRADREESRGAGVNG